MPLLDQKSEVQLATEMEQLSKLLAEFTPQLKTLCEKLRNHYDRRNTLLINFSLIFIFTTIIFYYTTTIYTSALKEYQLLVVLAICTIFFIFVASNTVFYFKQKTNPLHYEIATMLPQFYRLFVTASEIENNYNNYSRLPAYLRISLQLRVSEASVVFGQAKAITGLKDSGTETDLSQITFSRLAANIKATTKSATSANPNTADSTLPKA
jgi:hypothetical protein